MVLLGSPRIGIADFLKIVYRQESFEILPASIDRVRQNYEFIAQYSRDKIIYGINTGLGPMAQYKINDADQKQLQYNLIRSHSAGSGDVLSETDTRAVVLARLIGLLRGYSGVHSSTIIVLSEILQKDISPKIFRKGGVGASGDLVQLAHLALNLIGEGEMMKNGEWVSAKTALENSGIQPLEIHLREGLALMNGTSVMTGIGILNVQRARNLISISIVLSSLVNELMNAFDDHLSAELNGAKHHIGQKHIAEMTRNVLSDSQRVRHRPDFLYHQKREETVFEEKVQEYYSLRCVPQVLGPVYDTLVEVQGVLEDELNSVNDNPIIDHERQSVYHGGNFHGDYVSLAMDKLKIAVTKLTMLSERQINYLMNPKLNGVLPPFINMGKLGLNLGLQGMQFTATSTTAENQTLSYPMYLHSIPNNNDNQDIVSMGTNAALLTEKVIANAFDVLSIQTIAVCQAIDYLQCEKELSSVSKSFYQAMRKSSKSVTDDRPLYNDIAAIKEELLIFAPTIII